jgi:HJR/Mrr/RecB family endonuclease
LLAVLVIIGVMVRRLEGWAHKRAVYRRTLRAFRWDPEMTPVAFERHCADYLRLFGWSTQTTKASGDQGVDVIARKAGTVLVIQCKKQAEPVGNKAVQEIHAGRSFANAHYAAVVSNSSYTKAARELAGRTGVLLLHFTELAEANRLIGR